MQPQSQHERHSLCGTIAYAPTRAFQNRELMQKQATSEFQNNTLEALIMINTVVPNSGLPTRSCYVSRFMIGLEKTKAKSEELSISARAITLQDMHCLHDHCLQKDQSQACQHQGVVHYV